VEEKSILPTIVTTVPWREKIKEADSLGIKEIALFPTFLKKHERPELYRLLGKSKIERIPFVHIRGDFDLAEMDFLAKEYGSEIFNTHPNEPHPFHEYDKKIYMENIFFFNEEEFGRYAGISIDFSHLENDRQLQSARFAHVEKNIASNVVGCNHIGGITRIAYLREDLNEYRCDSHWLDKISDLDYLKKYPEKYFSKYIALEMENPLETQLRAKEYILNMF